MPTERLANLLLQCFQRGNSQNLLFFFFVIFRVDATHQNCVRIIGFKKYIFIMQLSNHYTNVCLATRSLHSWPKHVVFATKTNGKVA